MRKKVFSLIAAGSLAASLAVNSLCVAADEESGEGRYTYHSTTSLINTFSPTDWQLESEGDIIGYTMTALYEFAVNDTYDGYDIIPGAVYFWITTSFR